MPALSDVFMTSLRLGLSSFGGPVAHLGYFENIYVRRKQWLDHAAFSQTVALCQMLPGPTSSQVNFLIGLGRAGWAGALLSWIGFTLPSALVMYACAVWMPDMQAGAALHGLKLAAVAVVAQAVVQMARRLCNGVAQALIALAALGFLFLLHGVFAQLSVIAFGAAAGLVWCRAQRTAATFTLPVGGHQATAALLAFVGLLLALPALAAVLPDVFMTLADVFYRAGALVFGGGHVVLPLLHDALVPAGIVGGDAFLSAYGIAQAMPGPLFSVAAYLGAAAVPGHAAAGAVCALSFLFLPGLLLAAGAARVWAWVGAHPAAQGALTGINAAVVGVLAAALYNPVWQSAVFALSDAAIALTALLLLEKTRTPPVLAVTLCVAAAVIFS